MNCKGKSALFFANISVNLRNLREKYFGKQFKIIIYWSKEDKLFIAEVPELPGCMADGGSREKALKNAELIIKEWIETAKELGREIPVAKGKLIYA
jgi:predicted RNase H-like HicB family nuclease